MQTEGVGERHAAAAGASVARTQLCDDVVCGWMFFFTLQVVGRLSWKDNVAAHDKEIGDKWALGGICRTSLPAHPPWCTIIATWNLESQVLISRVLPIGFGSTYS